MKQTTRDLIQACLKKDPLAWEDFVRRYAHLVHWAITRSFTRYHFPFRPEDLEDTFQQVFSHVWEKGLKGLEAVERLEGWLAIVSHRIALGVVRKEGRERVFLSLEERLPGEEDRGGLHDLLPDPRQDPRKEAEGKDLREAVEEILNTLSEKEALSLRLHLLDEKTHAEISELLKVPIGTVSSLIKRTKEKVAVRLKRRMEEGSERKENV